MTSKFNLILLIIFFQLFFINYSQADVQEKLLKKYKTINTLHFDFIQNIGDKVEFGDCYIKYPLLMKCYYPKKKKSIISNGKRFVIVKKRYKKIYSYPLKKTPLFYLLDKKNILNVIQNYDPTFTSSHLIKYELTDDNLNKLSIFFDKNSLNLLGWKTIDAYANEVSFLIRNIETNILIKEDFFKIPREEDL